MEGGGAMTAKEIARERAKARFGIGDIIRCVRPYWGEPAYRIVDEEEHGFLAVWTGSKHGPSDEDTKCRNLIFWWDFDYEEDDNIDGPYEKCGWLMRCWLYLLGNTYGRIKNIQ